MMNLIRIIIRKLALDYGKFAGLYRKLCNPSGQEYAEFLRRHGNFHAIGSDCSIRPWTVITDPAYVSLGNNVQLGACTIVGHDGSIAMLGRAYGVRLDRTGKVEIRDNTFIGHGAIVLPGITIGPNAIVGAGAVVTKDVPPGAIVAGNPAKQIGTVEEYVKKLQAQTEKLPWYELIAKREGGFDPKIEPELIRMRVKYYYG